MNQASANENSQGQTQKTFFQRFPWEKITIWGLFLLLVYVLRSFFTTIFLTFIFSYIISNLVRAVHGIISPDREKLWLHRVLTVAAFALLIGSIYGIYSFLERPFREQIDKVVSTAQSTNLSKLGSEIIRETIGEWEYKRLYDGDDGEKKRLADFEEFKKERFNETQLKEFLRDWQILEENFRDSFRKNQGKERYENLKSAGELRKYLRNYLQDEVAPEIYKKDKESENGSTWDQKWEKTYVELYGRTAENRLSAQDPPLEELNKDPIEKERIRRQWILGKIADEELETKGETLPGEAFKAYVSNTYFDEIKENEVYWVWFKEFYEEEDKDTPLPTTLFTSFPNTDYETLESAYQSRENPAQFHSILFKDAEEDVKEEQIEQTFERNRKEELGMVALASWGVNPKELNADITKKYFPALTTGLASGGVFLFQFTVQFALSLLLSFFITFDLTRMKKGIQQLEHSRASNFYKEISPSLAAFGALIGRAFQAQGVIAICNTVLTFALIKGLSIPFETFLCTIVFLCSFIPVLGVVISTVPIALIALMYNGWSDAILSVVGVLLIHFVETSILNPKILGEMLHLHPVMVLCILAVGEHFFKVWGLLLGVPIMVYVIRYVIMGEQISDITRAARSSKKGRKKKGQGENRAGPGGGDPPESQTAEVNSAEESGVALADPASMPSK